MTDNVVANAGQVIASRAALRNGIIRVGVIGSGYWGPKLARNFHDLAGAELAMVSDLRLERLEEIQGLYPEVEGTQDYKEMLDGEVDAVVIATPVDTHFRIAREALFAGKHVLVEKPITSNSRNAKDLINIATDRGLTLMVGHTFLYNPAVEAVRDIVQSGELGNIYYLNSTRANLGLLQPDINVMWDLAPHDISILGFVLGKDPISVSALGSVYVNKSRKLHEVVYLTLFYDGGLLANLHLSWLDPVKQRHLTVVGSKKMLVYDDIRDEKITIFDKGVEVPSYSVTEEQFRASYRHGEETVYPLKWSEPLKAECDHFVTCIRTGASPRSNGENGLMVLNVLETAQRSLINGGCELQVEY
jgi:predicted dehydrogenase